MKFTQYSLQIMNSIRFFIKSLTFLALVFTATSFTPIEPKQNKTYTISIEVTNIRNDDGIMQFQLYRNQASFYKETPYKLFRISKKDVNKKTMTYDITGLKAGTYGVALLDDENSNKKMDYGWMMPTEGFGFSDYYHTGWSKPVFNDFKFELNMDKRVKMKVRYL